MLGSNDWWLVIEGMEYGMALVKTKFGSPRLDLAESLVLFLLP